MKICPVCSTEYPDDVRFCPNDGQTLRACSPAHDLVGQVVADRYHVLHKLGEGGMGQVYLAEHVKMGRKSAIKVMNPAMVHDPDAVARFNREAANASRITHPNVCAIYDFGETPEGLIYLAMEFIEGEPLTDLMEREGALPVHRAVSICVQVADALQAAHDLGIVHRDLKPDNIMLTRGRDGVDLVNVVDFGIGIDPARAYELVDDLFDKFSNKVLAAATIRDSALDIYRAPGVRPKDRAFAAYVASNAYARLDDRGKACQYAQESARLDPDNHPYQVLQNSLCQP